MNKIIILLLLFSIDSIAESILLDSQEHERIKVNLINTLEKVKKFKSEKNYQINKLNKKIKINKNKFTNKLSQKEKEIRKLKIKLSKSKKMNSQLKIYKNKFLKNQAKKEREIKKLKIQLAQTQKKLSTKREVIQEIEPPIQLTIEESMEQAMNAPVDKKITYTAEVFSEFEKLSNDTIASTPTALPSKVNLPWVEIVVDNGLDIYQLALQYYGDRDEYRQIYTANKRIIDERLNLYNGMPLKIPISKDFEEQPMIINTQ